MANRDLTPWTGGGGLTPFGRDPFGSFRREMDRLFDDFFTLTPAEGRSFATPTANGLRPNIELRENDQAYTVTAELAGLDPKDVELNLRENALVISGEKRQEHKEGDGGRAYTERSYGRFERLIPFDSEVDADKVEAKFKHGVLTVTLPKNAKAQDKTRRIEIKPQPEA